MSTSADAGLRYVSDAEPGITRHRTGKGFFYRGPDGALIKDPETLRWIRSLAIPPAYKDVWISPDPNGHLLATGRDDRGRKQYRYHPDWRAVREASKFERMLAFGRKLPCLRAEVERDLATPGLGRRKVAALVVRLLETTLIRVGNDEYAKLNKSFGLTTMRDRHLKVKGTQLKFSFKGKSGRSHEVTIRNRRLARLAQRCQEIPGQELFQFVDEEGQRRRIGSEDVNQYLREVTGEEFTAKDFRTWAGTVLAALALREVASFDSQTAAKRNMKQAIESVAARLGNTPTICRKSYVHPAIFDGYVDGTLVETLKEKVEQELRDELSGLSPEEAMVLSFLQKRLELEERGLKGKLEASLAREEAGKPSRRSRKKAA
jgi:DNA topoisomerase-1